MFKQTLKFNENLTMLYTKCHRHPGGKIWLSFKSNVSLAINCTHKEYENHTEDICVPQYMEPRELFEHRYVGLPIIREGHKSIKDTSITTTTPVTSTTNTTPIIPTTTDNTALPTMSSTITTAETDESVTITGFLILVTVILVIVAVSGNILLRLW